MAKPATNVITTKIAAGESLSGQIDLTQGRLVSIIIDDWDPAQMTFEVSPDNHIYSSLYDEDGNEVTIPVGGGNAYFIKRPWVDYVSWLRLRSGSRNEPEPQSVDVTITLVLET